MKYSREKVNQALLLLDETIPTFELMPHEDAGISFRLAAASLKGCRDLIKAMQERIEELEPHSY